MFVCGQTDVTILVCTGSDSGLLKKTSRPIRLRGGSGTPNVVEDAINTFRSRALDSGRQNEDVLEALKLMAVYCENVVKNPSETKFRRIKASNKAFAAKVAAVDGAVEVLAACGFQPVQEAPKEGEAPELFYKVQSDEAVAALEAALKDVKGALAFAERVTSETLGAMITTGYPTP